MIDASPGDELRLGKRHLVAEDKAAVGCGLRRGAAAMPARGDLRNGWAKAKLYGAFGAKWAWLAETVEEVILVRWA